MLASFLAVLTFPRAEASVSDSVPRRRPEVVAKDGVVLARRRLDSGPRARSRRATPLAGRGPRAAAVPPPERPRSAGRRAGPGWDRLGAARSARAGRLDDDAGTPALLRAIAAARLSSGSPRATRPWRSRPWRSSPSSIRRAWPWSASPRGLSSQAAAAAAMPAARALVMVDPVESLGGLSAERDLGLLGMRPRSCSVQAFPVSKDRAAALAEYGLGERTVRCVGEFFSGAALPRPRTAPARRPSRRG